MAITPDEQVKKLDEEINQLKARKQAILGREKQKQKKERNRRLIQYGELAEKYFDIKNIQPDKFEMFLNCLLDVKGVKEVMEHVKNSLL